MNPLTIILALAPVGPVTRHPGHDRQIYAQAAPVQQELPDHLKHRDWIPLERLGVEVRVRDPREHGMKQKNGVLHDDFQHLSAKTSAWPVGTRLRLRNEYGRWVDVIVTDNALGWKPGKIDNGLYLSGKAFAHVKRQGFDPKRWEVSVER